MFKKQKPRRVHQLETNRTPGMQRSNRTTEHTFSRQSAPTSSKRLWLVLGAPIVVICMLTALPALLASARADINSKQLRDTIQKIINANPQASIGVSIGNLSGSVQTIGSTEPFDGVSTTKLITAAAYLHLVETGRASLIKLLGDYPATFQLQQMVNQSNNDSWSLITQDVGTNQLQSYARSIGVSSYEVGGNTLTAADMATFLQKLYTGKLLNPSNTSLLLSYMQNTNNEDMIPAATPAGANVYHKYGQLNGDLHDVGIIANRQHSFILVIYTNGVNGSDYVQRSAIIREITQAVSDQL